jgi:2-oxoisovalerate dehydrogenase E1 component
MSKSKLPISFKRGKHSKDLLKELYYNMLKPRMIEEKMLILLRQGKISKWFSGIGQEAIAIGATSALHDDEIIFPMHRNLGVFTSRKIPLERLFGQWQGKLNGFTNGRDRSFHFGTLDYSTVGMISHLGPQLSLAAGVALAHKLRNENKVSLAFTGEGGTSEGEFHEALNVAAVWQLPVIFIIENNGYGLSTPVSEQYRCTHLADRAKGYGMKSHRIDGNNVLEVYQTIYKAAKSIRKKPQPVLIECETFRLRGHEEASGTKYVPKDLMAHWEGKDPVVNFEKYLLQNKIIDQKLNESWKSEIKAEIELGLQKAGEAPLPVVNAENEKEDVFSHHIYNPQDSGEETNELRFIDAISNGLDEAMKRHSELVLMGQDIADYGGVFKITEGFTTKYGKERVRNTPLCESAIVGISLGLSLKGIKSMVEMQFADFVTCGFNQIVNNLAKIHYRWGASADVVIRMPCGGGVGAGPFHSQTNEAWFFKTPGLKIVYPSNASDAKGLLLAAFEDPNPVLFFEHKGLYRSHTQEVPSGYFTDEIGKAKTVKNGSEACIISYGMGVHWAMETAERSDHDIEVLDLRSLSPLDYNSIDAVVKKCNRVLILHEDSLLGGVGGELSAYISEHLFEHLDAPIMRCASLDTPIPFNKGLEEEYLAKGRLEETLQALMTY